MNIKTHFRRYLGKAAPFVLALIGLSLLLTSSLAYKLGLFILYSLAGIYVYTRLKKLLPAGRTGRRIFNCVFSLLVLAYPVVELLSHGGQARSLKYVLLFGYYSLPFLLYVFLLTALADMLLAINRRLGIVPRDLLASRKLAAAALAVLLAGAMAIVILGRCHYENIKVNEYRVEIPGRSARIDQLKVALAADFHISDLTEPHRIETIIDKINSTRPDIILLPGDILEGDRQGVDVSRYAAMFRRLRATYGVYASLGNHEFHRGDWQEFFSQAGIEVLDDRWVKVDDTVVLAGRSFRHEDEFRSLDQVLQGAPIHLPLILLEHDPSAFSETLRHPVDVQVSGHTHHGQLFPLHWITRLKHDLSWGTRHIGRTHFFVTSGVQTWGYPVRTAGDSEIMLIRIAFVRR